MKALTSLFGRNGLLVLVGLILLSLAIWFGGPYLAFADYKPFASVAGRLVAILVLVVAWSLWAQLRQAREKKTEDKLTNDIVAQKDAPAVASISGRDSGDARQLRQRFEEAVAALRKSRVARGTGGARGSLYDLPWYVVIGPPGSGKTTAIVNSGLDFPLAQKFGKEALRGVGGTRNCDWWFTDRAVLLDTAGRYTTQDSDQSADAAGWREFLDLLRRYRKRRPINGVIVAMSATDLAMQSDAERRAHIGAVRQRLDELHRHLKISLPVYFMVTKCDLLAGFTEFFDDLGQEGRAQVWGVTFPLEASRSGEAARRLAPELDGLIERLNARSLPRLEQERDVQRRALMFAFPRQFASLRRNLTEFVGELFAGGTTAEHLELRGVYFTSGTQEGTPIDRMLSALARTFSLGLQAAPAQAGRGKAYFIQRLLGEVVFAESGLAGVNRQMELRQTLVQGAIYAAVGAITVLGLIWMSVSFGRNRGYLQEVEAAVQPLAAARERQPGQGLTGDLPRLDALREVVLASDKYRDDVPFGMRAGLYQGRSVGNAARDAYLGALNTTLLPAAAEHFRGRLDGVASDPSRLYEYLKAYLMLGQPKHLDPDELNFIGDVEWRRVFSDDPVTGERVAAHFAALIADPERVQPAQLDEDRVERARASLRQASLPVLVYSRLRLSHAGDADGALNLQNEIGLGADAVFIRRSGAPLTQPFPALYTRKVFDEVAGVGKLDLVRQFLDETWVLGDGAASVTDAPRIAYEVMQLYEQDYIRAWDELLADVQVKPTSSLTELTELMGLLSSPSSPLKGLLVLVDANTNLLKPAPGDAAAAAAEAAVAQRTAGLDKVLGAQAGADKPGTLVTRHFEPMHRLVAGPPGGAPIDQTLRSLGDIQQRLAGMGGGLGEANALDALVSSGQADALSQLQVAAKQLPEPVAGLVAQVGRRGESVATGQARSELLNRYRSQVVSECNQLVGGRYPFAPGAGNDVALADFGRLFGYGGVFDTFFKESLAPLVDTSRDRWRWKPGAAAIGGTAGLLTQFQTVDRIRQVYFRRGGQLPEMRFNVSPDSLDAAVTKLTVEVDGQTLDYRHGPQRAVSMAWPGPSPGLAAVRFEESGAPGPNQTWRGPWAFFRMLDDAAVQPQSDLRYLVTLTSGNRTAKVVIEATSVRNPFVRNELQRFRCGL